MGDVLSQSEVESLLTALDPAAKRPAEGDAPMRGGQEFDTQISVYDFKRPERVSKEQMRAFHALHEGFSREFGAAISGMLRSIVEVKLISVDQLTYSEFVFSLENPTCFNLLVSEGLEGHVILDLNPSIIFPIVDRLLGGGREATPTVPNRPLTEIELRLVSRITRLATTALENAWANIVELKLRVSQIESNPQLIQIVPPNEVIVLISFEVALGEIRGIMNLCIPFNTIEPLTNKLSSDTWSAYSRKAGDPRQMINLETSVTQAGVEVLVQLATTKISAAELTNLEVGDVILTEKPLKQPLKVLIEGRHLFQARAGSLQGHRAIRLVEKAQRSRDRINERLAVLEKEGQPAEMPRS